MTDEQFCVDGGVENARTAQPLGGVVTHLAQKSDTVIRRNIHVMECNALACVALEA